VDRDDKILDILQRIEADVAGLKTDVAILKVNVAELKVDMVTQRRLIIALANKLLSPAESRELMGEPVGRNGDVKSR
jgi:hypothetical protein